MTFPVEFHVFGKALPAHLVLELLAYTVGFQMYLLLRRRRLEGTSIPPLFLPDAFEQLAEHPV